MEQQQQWFGRLGRLKLPPPTNTTQCGMHWLHFLLLNVLQAFNHFSSLFIAF
jgi:hypothetical protein